VIALLDSEAATATDLHNVRCGPPAIADYACRLDSEIRQNPIGAGAFESEQAF